MALNFSHRPVFPAHMSEDNLNSPMRIVNGYLVEGIPDKGEGNLGREINEGRDRVDRGGSPELVSKDIIDLLPSDPFMMDISTTITAITGWFEDLEMDYEGYGKKNIGAAKEDYSVFAGLNLIWNRTVRNMLFDDKSNKCNEERGLGSALHHGGSGSVDKAKNYPSFKSGSSSALVQTMEVCQEGIGCCSDVHGGSPHEALLFTLSYLGMRDLLSVEMVCSSLHSMVRSDPFLWRNIHIDQPLNERITDDVLLQLTSKAQGNLQCLRLVECPRITDDGLKRVLDTNPRITKLCVPGCTRLSIEGIVNSLKAFKYSKAATGIKHLRIGGLYGITHEHFEELKFLVSADGQIQQNRHKPHFYHRGNFYLLCDDDRAIDIEICPRCQKLRLVYDCTAEGCQAKDNATQVCRACTLCIPRCVQCGRCISDGEYEETFCLELLCSDCFKHVLICQEKHDRQVGLIKNVANPDSSHNSFVG